MTARTKRRGFELARALSLTPRRARVRREVATSTVCRPARAEALSLSSRAESSIGEANLFPDSQPEHWCAGETSQPDGNRAWHFQPRKNLTVPTVRRPFARWNRLIGWGSSENTQLAPRFTGS